MYGIHGDCGTVYFQNGKSEKIDMYCKDAGGMSGSIQTESGRYYWKEVYDTIKHPDGGYITTKRVEWYKYDPTVLLEIVVEKSPWSHAEIDRIEIHDWVEVADSARY